MKFLTSTAKYLPYILAGVVGVEQAIQSAPGDLKKQIVTGIVVGAQVGEQIPEAHVAAIGGLIDTVVSTLNNAGIFGHKPVAAAA